MKNVAVTSCALSRARIRGTPTSGPYDWWLMGVIRLMAEMSVVSMGASASMSKVRQGAAGAPPGAGAGGGGGGPAAPPRRGAGGARAVPGGSRRLQGGRGRENTDHRRWEPSDGGANLPRRLILRYEGLTQATQPDEPTAARSRDVDHGP